MTRFTITNSDGFINKNDSAQSAINRWNELSFDKKSLMLTFCKDKKVIASDGREFAIILHAGDIRLVHIG